MAYGCGLGLMGFEPDEGVRGVVGMGEVGVVGIGGRERECERLGGDIARVMVGIVVIEMMNQVTRTRVERNEGFR